MSIPAASWKERACCPDTPGSKMGLKSCSQLVPEATSLLALLLTGEQWAPQPMPGCEGRQQWALLPAPCARDARLRKLLL